METINRTVVRNGHEISNPNFEKRTAYCSSCAADVAISKTASKKDGDVRTSYWRCAFSCGRTMTKDLKPKEHCLSNINEEKCTADCHTCGTGIRIGKAGKNVAGVQLWRCYTAIKKTTVPRKTDKESRKHFLSNVNEETHTAVCAHCGPVDLYSRGSDGDKALWRCATEARARSADPTKQRALKLRLNYGLTTEDYDRMFAEQNGLCAICKKPPAEDDTRLCVDHCHTTGRIRKLLCRRCNAGLGAFRDDPDIIARAVQYLINPPAFSILDSQSPISPIDLSLATT